MTKLFTSIATGEYAPGALLLFATFFRQNPDFDGDVALYTDDIEFYRKFFAANGLEKVDIRDVEKDAYKHLVEKHNEYRLAKAFYKLGLFKIEGYDIVVFVDSDAIIQSSIYELFDESLSFLAAVRDSALQHVTSHQDTIRSYDFNSGVMVIPKNVRSSNIFYDLLWVANNIENPVHADNDVLQEYFKKFVPLHSRYNVCNLSFKFFGSYFDSAKILHFIGLKPWQPHYHVAFKKWRKYAFKEYSGCAERSELPLWLNDLGLDGEGVEIGVFQGAFTSLLLESWRGKKVYAVDPWRMFDEDYEDVVNTPQKYQDMLYNSTKNRLRKFGDRCEILRETSEEAVHRFEDGSLDFVYIDAQHSYEAVKEDLNLWVPKVKQGGVVSGHDYMNGTKMLMGTPTKFGVKRAVDEFFGEDVVLFTDEGYPSWYVIKKSE